MREWGGQEGADQWPIRVRLWPFEKKLNARCADAWALWRQSGLMGKVRKELMWKCDIGPMLDLVGPNCTKCVLRFF